MWKQRRKSFSVFFQHHKKAANPCVLRGPGVFFITRFFSWKSRNRVFYIPSATFFFLEIVKVTKPCVFTVFQRLESTQKYRVHLFSRWLCFFFLLRASNPCVLRYFRQPAKKVPCKTRRFRSAAKKSRVFLRCSGRPWPSVPCILSCRWALFERIPCILEYFRSPKRAPVEHFRVGRNLKVVVSRGSGEREV